jgi:hypothetical protein
MRRIIFVLLLGVSIINFAQEDQNIELPDFIITGRQNVDVPSAQKAKPELISILSKDFFTPQYSAEDLPLLISSIPVPVIPEIKSTVESYLGSFKVAFGKYTLPVGELNFALNNQNYLLNTKIWGIKVDEYVPYAGYNNSGIKLTNDFFVSTRSEFMPGTKFSIDGIYWRDSYRLFASNTPDLIRETDNVSAKITLQNRYSRLLNFSFDAEGDLLRLKENNYGETNFTSNGLLELKWNKLVFGVSGMYQKQFLTNNLSNIGSYNFLSTEGYIFASPIASIWIKAGFYFNTNSSSSLYSPFASFEMLLDKGFTIGIEYKPKVEFLTTRSLLDKNLYCNLSFTDNYFTQYNNNLLGQLRYEYQTSLSIALSICYAQVDNYACFQDITEPGKFDLFSEDGVNFLKSKFNINYRGLFGNLFGEAVIQNIQDKDGRIIPNEPKFYSSLFYKYEFSFGFGIGIGYYNSISVFADITNNEKLQDYHNLCASVDYELLSGIKIKIDFQNILNRSNFTLNHYQDKPFDYLIGIEYRW